MPAFLACLGVERHQVVVGSFEKQIVVPDSNATITGVRTSASLPEVMPEQSSVARIHGPDVVRGSDIERIVEMHDRALDIHVGVLAFANASNNRLARSGGSAIQARHPGEGEVLGRVSVDLR